MFDTIGLDDLAAVTGGAATTQLAQPDVVQVQEPSTLALQGSQLQASTIFTMMMQTLAAKQSGASSGGSSGTSSSSASAAPLPPNLS